MSELSAAAIAAALTTCCLGRRVLFYPRIGSTNDAAQAEAATGAEEGLLVVADEQTAGRGRLTRRWWAPRATGLLFSLLLRPAIPPHRAGQLTMCLGLGAVEGIEAVTGLRPRLKWPNDLLLNDRKLGGMLTELRLDGARLDYAVLGLGINVNLDLAEATVAAASTPDVMPEAPPPKLLETATSLRMALGHAVDRLALLAAILRATEAWYTRLTQHGAAPHIAWAARLDTLGRRVTILSSAGALTGQALQITPEGGLVIRDDRGAEHVIWSGDVVSVRPA